VSLSLFDHLTLFIHPRRVVLEQRPWRGETRRQQAEVVWPADGEAGWNPALSGAVALLKTYGQSGATLRIIVADHFVRYALLPWSDAFSGRKARRTMALALLKNALGDKANALEIAIDRPVFARNGIAAGIDRQLLAGLRTAAKECRLRLHSLQPRLTAELSAANLQLTDGWFACIDHDWLALAGFRRGAISCLHNHRATTSEQSMLSGELSGLLAAESAAVDGNKVLVSCREVDVPSLTGNWVTTLWPPAATGEAHA
jgi:hypothetical protein